MRCRIVSEYLHQKENVLDVGTDISLTQAIGTGAQIIKEL